MFMDIYSYMVLFTFAILDIDSNKRLERLYVEDETSTEQQDNL